jgi:hypothetical protein
MARLGPFPSELVSSILEYLPQRSLHMVQRVNRAWGALATRELAVSATLGFPFNPKTGHLLPSAEIPVRHSQLAALKEYGSMTTSLDVFAHTGCEGLHLPHLETLRLIGPKRPCTCIATLRPRTLVVVDRHPLENIPASTLKRVKKLILVLPSKLSEIPELPSGPDIDVVLANADSTAQAHLELSLPTWYYLRPHWRRHTPRLARKGSVTLVDEVFSAGSRKRSARFETSSYARYFSGTKAFSDSETKRLRDPRRHDPLYGSVVDDLPL